MNLTQQLTQYRPWNEQEEADRRELLRRLESGEDLYTRSNAAAHLTASAWVVSPDRQQVLMAYHNLYDSWAWLGGHADGERDLLAVALREVWEEKRPDGRPPDYGGYLFPGNSLGRRTRKAWALRFLPPASERHLSVGGRSRRAHPAQAR